GSPLRDLMRERARGSGVRTVSVDGPWPNVGVVVDAMLGTGASGAPREPVAAMVERMAELRVPRVAIDGPTGLDLQTGVTYGPAGADLTITFGGPRRGHLLAREDVGDIVIVDIGHPAPDPEWDNLVTDSTAAGWLPRLRADDHKGTRGRVVVIGGAPGMSGAVRMAARAALAAGAGLVHTVTSPETAEAIRRAEPDLQTLSHSLHLPLDGEALERIRAADAVVIGPGFGRAEGRREFAGAVLRMARRAVVDADALTVFQDHAGDLAAVLPKEAPVLTPHPGEFRTLFPEFASHIESDPWSAAAGASGRMSATVLLKGVPTVIATEGRCTWTVAAGNPGLATGGSGDVLSGIIGAALAAGTDPGVAAALGAQVLGRAADQAARRVSARSLRPLDAIDAFPDLWRSWAAPRSLPHIPVLYELMSPQRI
ncbi:MAG: NAD(P)H-hydrate dehydratase, partial [Gemmatimonadales bacterium]